MDLDSLNTVLKVHENGSLARTARQLDIDPSSVSRILASVEETLGFRLFHRSTRSLTTTPEGAVYLARIAPLLQEIEAAGTDLHNQRTQPTGHIRITASTAFATQVLVRQMTVFQALYPDISVEVVCSDTNLDLVEHGIDLAIRLAPSPTGDLISRRLCTTRYRVVAEPVFATQHPLDDMPQNLTQFQCLGYALPNVPSSWQFRSSSGRVASIPVESALRMSNPLALRQGAREGLGFAILADWMIAQDLNTGALVDVLPNHDCALSDFETGAWLLYPSRQYLPRKVRAMIDFLKDRLSDG